MKQLSVVLATMVMAAAALDPRAALETGAKQKPATDPMLGTATPQGCYKSEGSLKNAKDLGVKYLGTQVSQGKCEGFARDKEQPVFAMKGDICYLGKEYPSKDDVADDSKCTLKCPGFPDDACGNVGDAGSYFSVWNTGIELDIPRSGASASESSAAGSKETDTADDKDDSGGVNVAGIAGGTVVGVVVLAAAVGGMFFYMRRKRNAEIEQEHRRNAAVNSFIGGGHSAGGSVTDARLEPIMAQRRMSDGSIKDNEDYSRRILRVTNV